MKFNIGDKVRVRGDLQVGDGMGCTTAVKDMLKYRNEIMTVKDARSSITGCYTIYELYNDGEGWCWTDEMLEPAYAEGGYVSYGKIPTPEKPIPIEEQLGYTIRDSLDSAFDAWRKLGGATNLFHENTISIKEDKPMAMFTFSTEEGYRYDKSNNTKIPTITTKVVENKDGVSATATCDKENYDERQGVLEALANLACRGDFDKQYRKAVQIRKREDEARRTCVYCGKVFDTVEEREAEEAWHVERRKARHERYKLRKRAKEIAFEEQAQKMAKEMMGEK